MISTMDCTFPRGEMAAALGRLASVLPTRTTLPVLNYVRISFVETGTVLLEATDLDRRAEVTVSPAEGCAAFDSICLPLVTVLNAAKAFPGVQIAFKGSETGVRLTSGGARLAVPMLPSSEFPALRLEEGDGFRPCGEGPASSILLAFSRVLPFVGTELAKPALLGVNFGSNGTGLVAVATNGHRLAKERVGEWEAEIEPATLVTSGVTALVRFFADSETLSVERSESRFRFKDESGASLVVPTLDTPYPNVEQLIPRDSEISVRIDRAALLRAVKRVGLIHRADDKGLFRTVVGVSSAGVTLHVATEDGIADETLEAEVQGPDLRIGFHLTYLIDALNSLSGETVIAEMKAPERATIWRSEGSEGLRLVMPLRLI